MAITERRLTAILAADVCDFSKMMGENEDRTIQNLRTCRELIEGSITSHNGNIFNTAGDSIVAEFGSVVDAVNCAVSFQETLRDRNGSVPEESKMEFRVGINLGDIIIGDSRILHAAHPNLSNEIRTVVTLWYYPDFDKLPEHIKSSSEDHHKWPKNWNKKSLDILEKYFPKYEGNAKKIDWNRIRYE